ncbi:MAG: hypothetical protein R3E31_15075 [Chloroflexota bacterium]
MKVPDLSRIEMGERIEFTLLSLNALVEPVVMAHQVQAQEAGVVEICAGC